MPKFHLLYNFSSFNWCANPGMTFITENINTYNELKSFPHKLSSGDYSFDFW